MHGWQHGDGLTGHVHAGEDHGRLGDAGQPLGQLFLGQVVELWGGIGDEGVREVCGG